MRKILILGLALILTGALAGCSKKIYETISPDYWISPPGYISFGDPLPKRVQIRPGWKIVQVFVYGDNDKLIQLPASLYQGSCKIYATYQIDQTTDQIELYFTGLLYEIHILY